MKPESPKATLIDVARMAGVSTATVSRVLNSPGVVQAATRERVENAIRQLGYVPNFGARALAARRTNTVAAVVPTLENAIFARGLEAFQVELFARGITLLVASSGYRPDIEDRQIRALVSRGADAFLLIGYDRAPETYDYLERSRVPYVVAWAYDPEADHPSVGFDNRAAMKALASEVIALGHVRLGMISAARDGNDRARNRWLGVLDAMQESGLVADDLALFEASYSIEMGRKALREMMEQDPAPTVILCGNDVLAAGALAEAREIGLNVPGDLSITGFDDIDISEIVSPPLTTVHVPHRRMGEVAAGILVEMLNQGGPGRREVIATEVVYRGTLGPPARAG